MQSSSDILGFEHGVCDRDSYISFVSPKIQLFVGKFCSFCSNQFFFSKQGKAAEISFWGQEKSQYMINKKIISLGALEAFLHGKPLANRESREARPARVGGPANISMSAMWTQIIIAKGPGSEKFQPKITMRIDVQNCWLTSVMIETNATVKSSIHVFRDLLDELALGKVLLGSSVSQLKARYMPSTNAKISSKGGSREKRIYRDYRVNSNSGSAKSRGSRISAEEALENYREAMDQLKQMQSEANSASTHASNI